MEATMEAIPATPEGFRTVVEAAEVLNTTPRTIRRWIASGRLRAVTQPVPGGSRYLIPEEVLTEAARR